MKMYMIKYKHVVGVTFLTISAVLLFFISSSKAAFLSAGGDNLGDHNATQNIKLNTFWLSSDGGDEGVYINSVGNVGIGTLAPFQKLHSTFFIRADSGFCIGADCITSWPAPGGLGDNLGNHTATQNLKMSGFWLSNDGGDEGLYINSVGNVGVGIINPGVKLEVAKSAREGTLNSNSTFDVVGNAITSRTDNTIQDLLRLHQPNTVVDSKGSTFAIGLSFPDDPGNNYPRTRVDFKTTGRAIDSANAANIVMSLVDSGNVGIGTTIPMEALHVIGSVQATSFKGNLDGIATLASSLAANGANCSAGYYPLGVNASGAVETCTILPESAGDNLGNHIATQNIKTSGFWLSNDGGNEGIFVITNGNVGIGTSGATAPLDVRQTTALGGVLSDSIKISSFAAAGGSSGNNVYHNEWRFRDAAGSDWLTHRIHDAISVDGSYTIPRVNTRTFWERDPQHDIQTWGTGATDYLTINAGKVGIGTTAPLQALQVIGSVQATSFIGSLSGNATTATSLAANGANCSAGYYPLGVNASGAVETCTLAGGNDNLGNHIATQNIRLGSYWLSGDGNNEGVFVAADGKVGIGTTAPAQALEVIGSVQATSFIYTSDVTLKNNVQVLKNSLNKINSLEGVSFNWNKDGSKEIGLIAQDVEKVVPELVVTTADGIKAVKYGNIVALLIEAIKEQQVEIDVLKIELENLKNN